MKMSSRNCSVKRSSLNGDLHVEPKGTASAGLLKGLCSGRLKNAQVAAALGITVRHVRRLKRRFEAGGAAALIHGSRGRPSSRRLAAAVRAAVVRFMTTL